MNDLDDRLSAWNPVRADDVLDAAASAEAAGLLQRVLNQPIASPSRRQSSRPRRPVQAWLAAAAAIAVAAAGIGAAVLSPHRQASAPKVSSGPPVTGFQRGPSQGVAKNAVELVDYATRAATMTPVFVPGPRDWEYHAELHKGRGLPARGGVAQTWQQVGTYRNAGSWDHGKVTYGNGGGPGARLTGWPGNWTSMYQYLASLPARPSALRKVILANNHSRPGAAFTAIGYLLEDFPLPARFQAELYAVLVSLPGVHFARDAVDAAGRPGVGLYVIQDGYLVEFIINPRTYVYMGGLGIAVRAHDSYSTLLTHPREWSDVQWSAILGSGIVSRAGQLP
jgi:hypothetical protein